MVGRVVDVPRCCLDCIILNAGYAHQPQSTRDGAARTRVCGCCTGQGSIDSGRAGKADLPGQIEYHIAVGRPVVTDLHPLTVVVDGGHPVIKCSHICVVIDDAADLKEFGARLTNAIVAFTLKGQIQQCRRQLSLLAPSSQSSCMVQPCKVCIGEFIKVVHG